MSEARRYPLSEWGAQRLRRLGVRPSTAGWYTAAWSTALLLCVYGLSSTAASFAEKFVEMAAGYGRVAQCADRSGAVCLASIEPGRLLFSSLRESFVVACGLATGIVVLAATLRVLGARPDARPAQGWRSSGVTMLVAVVAGVGVVAVGALVAPEAAWSIRTNAGEPQQALMQPAKDWWLTLVAATIVVSGTVAAIHQWAVRLDFQARWRMTERERRDELRDTQMSPDMRRASAKPSNQR